MPHHTSQPETPQEDSAPIAIEVRELNGTLEYRGGKYHHVVGLRIDEDDPPVPTTTEPGA